MIVEEGDIMTVFMYADSAIHAHPTIRTVRDGAVIFRCAGVGGGCGWWLWLSPDPPLRIV